MRLKQSNTPSPSRQSKHSAYLETLLKARRLVLRVLRDGRVRTVRHAAPNFFLVRRIPILVGGLIQLRANLTRLLRARLDERFG